MTPSSRRRLFPGPASSAVSPATAAPAIASVTAAVPAVAAGTAMKKTESVTVVAAVAAAAVAVAAGGNVETPSPCVDKLENKPKRTGSLGLFFRKVLSFFHTTVMKLYGKLIRFKSLRFEKMIYY